MTYKEAAATAIDLLGAAGMDGLKDKSIYYRHLKIACSRFLSETAAMIRRHDITPDGSTTYSLIGTRVGRLWSAQYDRDSSITDVRIRQLGWFHRWATTTNAAANDRITDVCRDGTERIRVHGIPSNGTLTLYHAPTPTIADRDSLPSGETVTTGSSTTTVCVTTPSRGNVANGSSSSDYYKGCQIVFRSNTTTTALRNARYTIASHNESASPVVFTTSETMNATPADTDVFDIEDVLDVPERFALACIDYAAGRVGLRVQGYDALCKQLLTDFAAEFRLAQTIGLDPDPAVDVMIEDDRDTMAYGITDIYR